MIRHVKLRQFITFSPKSSEVFNLSVIKAWIDFIIFVLLISFVDEHNFLIFLRFSGNILNNKDCP